MQLTYNVSAYDDVLIALPEQDITLVGVPGISEPIKWSKKKIYGRPSMGVFEIQFRHEDAIYYFSSMSDNYGWGSKAVEPDPDPSGDYYTRAEIDARLALKQGLLVFDNKPTKDSLNPVTSDAIWRALQEGGENKILTATINSTSQTELTSAIQDAKTIIVKYADNNRVGVSTHCAVVSGHIEMFAIEYDLTGAAIQPKFAKYTVTGTSWVATSVDAGLANVYIATKNVTSAAHIKQAIEDKKTLVLCEENPALNRVEIPLFASATGSTVAIYSVDVTEYTAPVGTGLISRPRLLSYSITGTTWSTAETRLPIHDEVPFITQFGVTSATKLRDAIVKRRQIVVVDGVDQPVHTVLYSALLPDGKAYLVTTAITTDTERWDRKRPTFKAYTVTGSTWDEADPLVAVVEEDLTNVVAELPTAGVENTRYLLKVIDNLTDYHLDEYIYVATESKWVSISRDRVFVAIHNTTTSADLRAAMNNGKAIVIKFATLPEVYAVFRATQSGTDTVNLHTMEMIAETSGGVTIYRPVYIQYVITDASWAARRVALAVKNEVPLIAKVNNTTDVTIGQAIADRRGILVDTGDNQPVSTVVYSEKLSGGDCYLVTEDIIVDTDRWDRKRPTVRAYTIRGSIWTVAEPIKIAVEGDFANIVEDLPETGAENTRYLKKVDDDSASGYHLEEFVYDATDGWVGIGADGDAVFEATQGATTAAELRAAITANKMIAVKTGDNAPRHPVMSYQVYTDNSVSLLCCAVKNNDFGATIPTFTRFTVSATTDAWTSTVVDVDAFVATINVTSGSAVSRAISDGKPVIVKDDTTGILMPALRIQSTTSGSATLHVLLVSQDATTSAYTAAIVVYSVVGNNWGSVQIDLATKADLDNYVPKLNTPISASTTNYIRAFKMNADGLITGTSGSYTKTDTISSSSTVNQLPSAKAVVDHSKGTRVTGDNAFIYNTAQSQGYKISGDYATNTPRQLSKVGRRVNLSFCCKGTAVAAGSAWTSIGNVPAAYKPVSQTSIVAQVYNGTTNEAAGGYIATSGWIVLWTDAKPDTNNYQVRINACWDVE